MASEGTLILCSKCRKRVTEGERTASHTCPKCDHRGPNAIKSMDVVFVYGWERPWWVRIMHRLNFW